MTSNNAWASNAVDWLENLSVHRMFEEAKENLKDMMPKDAKRAFGHGVQVTRAKNGALTVRTDKEDQTDA